MTQAPPPPAGLRSRAPRAASAAPDINKIFCCFTLSSDGQIVFACRKVAMVTPTYPWQQRSGLNLWWAWFFFFFARAESDCYFKLVSNWFRCRSPVALPPPPEEEPRTQRWGHRSRMPAGPLGRPRGRHRCTWKARAPGRPGRAALLPRKSWTGRRRG